MRRNKVDIITLGCSKNLVDSERLMCQFRLNGYTVAHDPAKVNGEIVIVNTCAFIGDAQEESVNVILDLEEARKQGRIGKLFVMGCLSERFKADLQQELPFVDRFYGKFDWKELLHDLGKPYHQTHAADRVITTPKHYAYLKISEGCDRTCAYCSIPLITGRHKSRPEEDILDEVRQLVDRGVKEFQLIAQDLTYYGMDLYRNPSLPALVEKIADVQGVEWIRLHYAYPSHFPFDLLRVMRERDNVCRYLDIALQHVSDTVLQRMRRNTSRRETWQLIERLRDEVPGIHLRTTLMTGYPGETERDFEELLQFVRDVRFERLGAFAYSHESGTYAGENYCDDVPDDVKQQRLDSLMRIQEKIAWELNDEKTGRIYKTVIDREENSYFVGRTEFDSPEVDPEVLIPKEKRLQTGSFYDVKIKSAEAFELYGEILNYHKKSKASCRIVKK
ncbi:MAG: 30S ribosomal protein S12 methylthiotransferase RimO [Tannerella sp.]|jgi:ribosomal protein S12 methylthiotransferase|nr:30S ribosomal protein S12 methylthiotransferase RimO [Tannerella sp.]